MKVLLVDLDQTGFPNLALMKLSAWHKQLGAEVYLNQPIMGYDLVEASCVFSWNLKKLTRYPTPRYAGGIAFNMNLALPPSVEHIMPDYGLYNAPFSLGLTSRGCPNKCPWCVEWQRWPHAIQWGDFHEFWDRRHSHIKLLDPNLLAAPNAFTTLQDLAKEPVSVDFNQALDVRLVDENVADLLSKINIEPCLRFSFDSIHVAPSVRKAVHELSLCGFRPSSLSFYVMVGFGETFEEEYSRLRILKELGCQAHVMFYRDRQGVERMPAQGFVREEDLPRGSRRTIRKYARLARRSQK